MNRFVKSLSGLALISLSLSATADMMTIEAEDWGWYFHNGDHQVWNENTVTGTSDSLNYNSFYTFNVGGIENGSRIISATINFAANNGDYISDDPFETLEIWDVDSLPGLGSSTGVYNDLMTGTKYGEADVYKGENNAMPGFSVELNELSFSDILADEIFSVGAHISSIDGNARQFLWSNSGFVSPAATLTIEYAEGGIIQVYEPGILAIIGLGLLSLGYTRRSSTNQRD